MHKITIKELVDFRRKSTDTGRKNYAYKLKNRKANEKDISDESSGGGDYWVTSTSSIYNVFKYDRNDFYDRKINDLISKSEETDDQRVKSMYQRNIDIINNFKDFTFKGLRPSTISKFETVQKVHTILQIDDFPLYIKPSLLFSYERNGKNEIGAIWLVPKLHGFKKVELGMFCEMLHKFLLKNYSGNYQISDDLCIAIDTFNAQKVVYQDLKNGDIPFLIDKTLEELKKAS